MPRTATQKARRDARRSERKAQRAIRFKSRTRKPILASSKAMRRIGTKVADSLLTEQQHEVLKLTLKGMKQEDIAKRLHITQGGISHLKTKAFLALEQNLPSRSPRKGRSSYVNRTEYGWKEVRERLPEVHKLIETVLRKTFEDNMTQIAIGVELGLEQRQVQSIVSACVKQIEPLILTGKRA